MAAPGRGDFTATLPVRPETSTHPRQALLQAIESLVSALDGVMFLHHTIAVCGRFEQTSHGEKGFAVVFLKGQGYLKLARFTFFSGMGVDQTIRPVDLDEDDPVLVVHTLRAVHDEIPGAARPNV